MPKKAKIGLGILFIFLLSVFSTGCDLIKKDGGGAAATDFKKGPSGLVMQFVKNYPGDSYIASSGTEEILVMIDVRNKGTYSLGEGGVDIPTFGEFLKEEILADAYEPYANQMTFGEFFGERYPLISFEEFLIGVVLPPEDDTDYEQYLELRDLYLSMYGDYSIAYLGGSEGSTLSGGKIYLSGFDKTIIDMTGNSKSLSSMFLPAASPINPLGGFDTAEFEGNIIAGNLKIDEYNPTILATACYPYGTKASPTVCIDPLPFDDRQEKVCNIGSYTLQTQGAPVAVTKIDQEAATGKIQFRISIKNVGGGDVLKPDDAGSRGILDKCSPFGTTVGGEVKTLDRKDFDRVKVKSIEIANKNLVELGKCSPFADGTGGTTNLIRLFNGEGFIICTLDVGDLGSTPSAYTTPMYIDLEYNYRSTISKSIRISKLTTI